MSLDDALDAEDTLTAMLDVSILLWEKAGRVTEEGLSPEERTVQLVTWVETQVSNGGWLQWMYNTTVPALGASLDALQRVACREVHRVAVEALSVPVIDIDGDSEESKVAKLDALSETELGELSKLDEEFYRTTEDYMGLCKAFVVQHRERFSL
jgi:hypothetical protein